MPTLRITVHSGRDMPNRLKGLSRFKKLSPRVVLWVGKNRYETKELKGVGDTADFEETCAFEWDGRERLAIDLMSGSTCFAKAWVMISEMLHPQGFWRGDVRLDAHDRNSQSPSLHMTLINEDMAQNIDPNAIGGMGWANTEQGGWQWGDDGFLPGPPGGMDMGGVQVQPLPGHMGGPGFPPHGFHDPNFPQQGFPQQGFPQQGFPQQGFPQQGFPQQGFPQQGFPQQGFPQQEFPQQGFPQHGFNQPHHFAR